MCRTGPVSLLTSQRLLNSLCSIRSSSLVSRLTMVACRGVLSRMDSPNAVPIPRVQMVTASCRQAHSFSSTKSNKLGWEKQHMLKTSIHHKSASPEHGYISYSPQFVRCVFVLFLIIYLKNKFTENKKNNLSVISLAPDYRALGKKLCKGCGILIANSRIYCVLCFMIIHWRLTATEWLQF